MKIHEQIYIDGAWVKPHGGATFDVINATTEEVMGRIPGGDAEDVDRAVRAARAAFPAWSALSVEERADYLDRLQGALGDRMQEIGETVAQEVGMPLKQALPIQGGFPAMLAGMAANVAREYAFEERTGNTLVVREPIGVVGCITPWNYPLLQIMQKIGPALAAGCTVVVKPTEVAPLAAFMLAEAVHQAGFPPGVFNLVSGDGPTVGEALAAHPDVDMISFTGSTRAGRRVSEVASQTVKRVALELGGKSANVVLDDADLEAAVAAGLRNCYLNAGQSCIALSRMLVPRSLQPKAVEIAKRRAEALSVGDPLVDGTRVGPVASAAQQERVRKLIRRGIEEGATLVTGGPEQPEGLTRGYFVRPTVFSDVTSDMTIAQDEIFGPVLSIMPYDDEADAVKIANDTIYGLSGAVWSGDPERAERVARQLRTGQVSINGGRGEPGAPFGGYKQSGNGRESGRFGLEEFLEVKALQY
jgi:acyl-CoA reductase-like NAD-dependent aldehyde dehydrogenase